MSWHLERFENKYKNEVFESSSERTEQFQKFYDEFVKTLETAVHKYFPSWKIISVNDGHFEIFGFIKRHDGQMFYSVLRKTQKIIMVESIIGVLFII